MYFESGKKCAISQSWLLLDDNKIANNTLQVLRMVYECQEYCVHITKSISEKFLASRRAFQSFKVNFRLDITLILYRIGVIFYNNSIGAFTSGASVADRSFELQLTFGWFDWTFQQIDINCNIVTKFHLRFVIFGVMGT